MNSIGDIPRLAQESLPSKPPDVGHPNCSKTYCEQGSTAPDNEALDFEYVGPEAETASGLSPDIKALLPVMRGLAICLCYAVSGDQLCVVSRNFFDNVFVVLQKYSSHEWPAGLSGGPTFDEGKSYRLMTPIFYQASIVFGFSIRSDPQKWTKAISGPFKTDPNVAVRNLYEDVCLKLVSKRSNPELFSNTEKLQEFEYKIFSPISDEVGRSNEHSCLMLLGKWSAFGLAHVERCGNMSLDVEETQNIASYTSIPMRDRHGSSF